jgi:hypothetical protein
MTNALTNSAMLAALSIKINQLIQKDLSKNKLHSFSSKWSTETGLSCPIR